ncbi:MAG: response regulator [Bacteroidia bacterium]
MSNSISKILIVDDNNFYLALLKTILKDVDAEIFMANSGKDALHLIYENDFALAIIDIQMPEMDGFELATHIQNLSHRDLVPFIFLTADFSDEIQMFKGYDTGAIDYLTKPINKTIFISKVKVFLELDLQKRSLITNQESLQKSKVELEMKQNELKLQNAALEKAQAETEESRKLYHSLLKTSPDGIIITDLNGRIIEASDIAIKLLGNMVGKNIEGIHFMQFIPKASKRDLLKIYRSTVNDGMIQNHEIKLNRFDKTEFNGEISASQIKDSNGQLKAYMTVMRDISERKLIEKQLRHSERMSGIGELATGMAHEINQPLNTISLTVDNIIFSLDNKTITESYLKTKIDKVFDSISRIKKIIDHVRTFARDQDDFVQTGFDINSSINNCISMISEQLHHLDVHLKFSPIAKIPAIKGNAYRFEQVILNLLVNAKDAIEEKQNKNIEHFKKKIEISAYIEDQLICIEIKDNGIGISPEDIDKVLLPFYTTKDPGHGTGLGLSISYGIIKELNGEIEIQSKLQIGTTILIKIPIKQTKSNIQNNKHV